MEKKEQKRKLNPKKVFSFLIVLFILVGVLVLVFSYNIKNIYITGNKNFSDQEIIDIAKLTNYPKFFLTFSNSIKNRLEKEPLIRSADVKKGIFGKIRIAITEYKILFYDSSLNYIILDGGESVSYDSKLFDVPTLISTNDFQYYDSFLNKMTEVEDDILAKISQIEYKPNDIDNERFLLYMDDGNYVYVTLLDFEAINNYNNIVPLLEGKRGILYLDSGNYFNIIE